MRLSHLALPVVLLWVALPLAGTVRAAEPLPPPGPDLSGDWPEGSWESETTSHCGPLRASFCKINETQYRVVFRGRFWAVIPFRYAMTLDVVGQEGDRVLLAGSSRLGPLLGTYAFTGWATATEFEATYCARNDRGTFRLSRCRCGK